VAGTRQLRARHLGIGLVAVLLFTVAGPLRTWFAQGAYLGSHSLTLGDNTPGATTNYLLSIAGQSGGTVGSIRLQICANDPLVGRPCTPPPGFSFSGATLINQTGITDFSIDTADSTANELVLTHPAAVAPSGTATYELSGVVNPTSIGTFYGRIVTYASTDGTGAIVDRGGLALATNGGVGISTYVPPYLLFCTGTTIQPYDCSTADGDYIDFGNFTSTKTSTGQTKLLASTNADTGYTIRAVGGTLTSGNNVIPALTTPDVSRIGVSQFGINLRSNTTPNTGSDVQGPGSGGVAPGYDTANFYQFNSGDVIAESALPDDYRMYTATYITNVSKDQAPGVYVSTLTYICLANF